MLGASVWSVQLSSILACDVPTSAVIPNDVSPPTGRISVPSLWERQAQEAETFFTRIARPVVLTTRNLCVSRLVAFEKTGPRSTTSPG